MAGSVWRVRDELWEAVKPLIPDHPLDPRGGSPRVDDVSVSTRSCSSWSRVSPGVISRPSSDLHVRLQPDGVHLRTSERAHAYQGRGQHQRHGKRERSRAASRRRQPDR
jgi:hypothetical protein